MFVGSSCWCHPICASTLISLCSPFLQRLIYFEENHGRKFCLCSEVWLWKWWALRSCPVFTECQGTVSRRGWWTEPAGRPGLAIPVELSGSTSEQPKPSAIIWFIRQLWQLYLKLALNMHILYVQLHTTIIDSIFLWQLFCTAFRFGKKPHQNQLHYPFVHPQTPWILPCSEQDKVSYHRTALGTFLSLQPDRICWAKGFSRRS